MKCIITLEIGSENRVLVEVFDISKDWKKYDG